MATFITSNDFSRCEGQRSVLHIQSRPIRTVLFWQAVTTIAAVLIASYVGGTHAAVSAGLGGFISIAAGVVSVFVSSLGKAKSAPGALLAALRAEGAKIAVMVVLLWIVFATYKSLVALVFLGTFIATMLIFSMAFFVRDEPSRDGVSSWRPKKH